jgi:hypothetical protein
MPMEKSAMSCKAGTEIRWLCGWCADLAEAYNESLYMRAFPASLLRQAGHVCN